MCLHLLFSFCRGWEARNRNASFLQSCSLSERGARRGGCTELKKMNEGQIQVHAQHLAGPAVFGENCPGCAVTGGAGLSGASVLECQEVWALCWNAKQPDRW